MTVVVFDYTAWSSRFPEFATTVNSGQASDCFVDATLYLDNTDGSPVQDIPIRTRLLYLLTSHVAQISHGSSLAANNPIVGRIDGATEGSVTFTTKYPDQIGMAAWLSQTKYGAQFWAATSRYRSFTYRAPPRRRFWPA